MGKEPFKLLLYDLHPHSQFKEEVTLIDTIAKL